MKTSELETAVVNLIDPRLNAIVPNVSWGLGLRHECDLLYLDGKNRFTEVELKVIAADLRADFRKPHGHSSDFISRLVYAVPSELVPLALELVPKQCGIIEVVTIVLPGDRSHHYAKWIRVTRHNALKTPSQEKIIKFLRLGTIRIWKNKRLK